MGVESTIRAGVGFPILTDGYNLSGALTAGTSPAYYFYSGGSGQYNSISGSNVSGSLYLLTVAGASVPAQNGVVILTAASGIVTRQFQVFPDGPIKGVAQRVWFVKVSSSTGLAVSGGPAPTCEWFVPGSSTPVTLTPGNGAQPDFWYVDLSSGQTNVDAGLLRVTGSGLIPLSIEMFFSTAATSGVSVSDEEETMTYAGYDKIGPGVGLVTGYQQYVKYVVVSGTALKFTDGLGNNQERTVATNEVIRTIITRFNAGNDVVLEAYKPAL